MAARSLTEDDLRGLLATTGPLVQRDVWIAANTALGLDYTGAGLVPSEAERAAARGTCELELARRRGGGL